MNNMKNAAVEFGTEAHDRANYPSRLARKRSAEDAAMPEDDWKLRGQKRQGIINTLKASPGYPAMRASRRRVLTPDPADRNISKRQWEHAMLKFRLAVRREETEDASATGPASA